MTLEQNLRPTPLAIVPVPAEPPPPQTIRGWISKFLSPRTSPANLPMVNGGSLFNDTGVGGFAMVTQNTALARPTGAATYRAYAETPWVFAGINIRKNQVSSAEWDIVPFDNTKRFASRQRDRLLELFNQPSARLDSFQSWAAALIDDLLTLDGAAIEKVRYPDGSIGELWPVRGEWIAVDERWDGSDPEKPRYYYIPDGTVRAAFRNDDMVYMIANQRANSAVGLSPMYILQKIIEGELQGNEYNRKQVVGAAPDGVLNIGESANPEDVQKAESKFSSRNMGQGSMAVIGGYKSPSWMPFRTTNRDMQFRELQDYYIRCIATVLGLSPMDLAITFDVNRSTAEAQDSHTEDRGLKPLKSLFQNYMTREIVWDESFGGRGNNLAFKFADLNLDETLAKANINKVAMPGVPTKSINEARRDAGRAPIGDATDDANVFNHLVVQTPKGMLDITTSKYIGEEDLAKITAETQMTVNDAKAESDAANAPPPAPAPAPAKGGAPNG